MEKAMEYMENPEKGALASYSSKKIFFLMFFRVFLFIYERKEGTPQKKEEKEGHK